MIFTALTGALNAFSRSQDAFFNRALRLGDTFQMVISDSLGAVFVWIQPPEVPKAYYGLDDGTFLSFFKSRLRYLYFVFFLTLGVFCMFHFMFRIRKHDKRNQGKSSPSPKHLSNMTNEKGVQTFINGFPEGEELMEKIAQDGHVQVDEQKKYSKRRKVHEIPSKVREVSNNDSPSKERKVKPRRVKKSPSPTKAKKLALLSRRRKVNEFPTKVKEVFNSDNPQKERKVTPKRVKKSSSPTRTKKLTLISKRRKASEVPPKVKEHLNSDSPPKAHKVKSRQVRKPSSPTRTHIPRMKTKPESAKRKSSRDPKRCKTCKKIRPFTESQTPDHVSIFNSRRPGYADSLFCFNPSKQFNSTLLAKARINDKTRDSNAVSAVLRGGMAPNDEKKSMAEDTNMNKTLRQEGEKMGQNAYNRNLAKLISGNKLLLSTTSANRSVHNILLDQQQTRTGNIERQQQRVGVHQDVANNQSFNDVWLHHDRGQLDPQTKGCHVSRYEKHHRNLDFGDENRRHNIQDIERQRFGSCYNNVQANRLQHSNNLYPRKLLQRRALNNQHTIHNTVGFGQNFEGVGLSGDQKHQEFYDINKIAQNTNNKFVYVDDLGMKTLSQPHWFELQHPDITNKSFKITPNKWRNRSKPYARMCVSKNTNTTESPDICDISTISAESAKLVKSFSARNKVTQTYHKQQQTSDINKTQATYFAQVNTRSEHTTLDPSTNTTSSVNSPLNKNNCSPSRLNKPNPKNVTSNHGTIDEQNPITTAITTEQCLDKSIEKKSPKTDRSRDDGRTMRVIQDMDTQDYVVDKSNETDSTKKTNYPQAVGRSSLARRPSPLRLIQRKIRSISTPRKSLKSLRSPKVATSPGTKNNPRKLKSDRRNHPKPDNDYCQSGINLRVDVFDTDNLVSLGIQTSETSLRNTAVQTSPVEFGVPWPKDEGPEKNISIEGGFLNNNPQGRGRLTSVAGEETLSHVKSQDAKSTKEGTANNQILPTSTVAHEDAPFGVNEKTCPRVVDVVDIKSRDSPLRRLSLPPRSSSCSRTPDRHSSCGSSPVSVLLGGHAWMGRPRWEDANVDEVNRRVERALKLRQELQRNKKERLRSPYGRTLSCDPVVKSSSCIVEEPVEVNTFTTQSSRSHEVLNDEIDIRGHTSYNNQNLLTPGGRSDLRGDVRIKTRHAVYNDQETDTCINNIRINGDGIPDSIVPDDSNSNRKSLRSGERDVRDKSETTDTNVKTLPFNVEHVGSDILHPLSSGHCATTFEKKSQNYRVDNTHDNLSSLDSSLGAIGLRNTEECKSYHGEHDQNMISNLRVRPASTSSFSRFADEVPRHQRHCRANRNLAQSGESNKNSPPIKISKTENVTQPEYPRLVGELVQALPHVPLAAFLEWFIETSNPGQSTGSDDSASPEVKHDIIKSTNTPLSDCTETDNNPATLTNQTHCFKTQPLVPDSDVTGIQTPVEFIAGDSSDNHAYTLSDSPDSNVIYDENNMTSCGEQMTNSMVDDNNKGMKTSIRRIWLTRELSIQHNDSSCSSAASDNERRNMVSFRGSVPTSEKATPKSDNLLLS